MSKIYRIFFYFKLNYIWNFRGVNNEVLDAYMLKSLDGFVEIDLNQLEVFKCPMDGKLRFRNKTGTKFPDNHPIREGYDRILVCAGFRWDDSIFDKWVVIPNRWCNFWEPDLFKNNDNKTRNVSQQTSSEEVS